MRQFGKNHEWTRINTNGIRLPCSEYGKLFVFIRGSFGSNEQGVPDHFFFWMKSMTALPSTPFSATRVTYSSITGCAAARSAA